MASLKEQIQAQSKVKTVPIKFGAVDCFLRRWTEKDQIEWAIECQTSETKSEVDGIEVDLWLRCKAIARSLCDSDGVLIFDHYNEVAAFDSEIIDPVFDAVVALQQRSEDAAKKN